jgi:hypothetical protein
VGAAFQPRFIFSHFKLDRGWKAAPTTKTNKLQALKRLVLNLADYREPSQIRTEFYRQ